MAHPMAGGAHASEQRRLRILGAKPGKAWGSSKMYDKRSYPKKRAGTQVAMTISGGKARKRADRAAQRLADGGGVGGKRKKGHTTNIVIAGGNRGGPPAPGPGNVVTHVHRHVHAGVARPPIIARPALPVGAAPIGAAPVAPVVRRPIAPIAPPVGGAGLPPPVPPAGGFKRGGSVKKRAKGGAGGRAYRGFPHSPTTETDSAVSAHKRGGKVRRADGGPADKRQDDDDDDQGVPPAAGGPPAAGPPPTPQKRGGHVKKRQLGGIFGQQNPAAQANPPVQGPPTLSGRPARPAQPLTVPLPNTLAARLRARPAPGTQVGFKKGGKAKRGKHGDEAEDRRLFKKMFKQEERKEKKRGEAT